MRVLLLLSSFELASIGYLFFIPVLQATDPRRPLIEWLVSSSCVRHRMQAVWESHCWAGEEML